MAFGLARAHLVLDSPITQKFPASAYWGIDATIQYGDVDKSGSVLLNTGSGIVDTGTTLLYLSTSKLLRDSKLLPDMCTQTHNTPYYVRRI
jgi:hypothetical protein